MAENRPNSILTTLSLVSIIILTIFLLIIPIPNILIDVLIVVNIIYSFSLLLVSLSLGGSTYRAYPLLLTISSLFRLSLGILIARAMMLTASGGSIVSTFGQLIYGGNFMFGMIITIFFIILSYTVMALSGQRMSKISNNLISTSTNEDSDFYRSLKISIIFIRAVDIIVLVLIFVTFFGGSVVGILQLGMPVIQAIQVYAIITTGMGIILQILGLIISGAMNGFVIANADREKRKPPTDGTKNSETAEKFCSTCGEKIRKEAEICPKCGVRQMSIPSGTVSNRWLITFLLCLFLGNMGGHRFYNGKIGTGILMLLTFGCFGIWTFIDLIVILTGNFTDINGNAISSKT
jgi:type III secretory pathway component EscV